MTFFRHFEKFSFFIKELKVLSKLFKELVAQ